WAFACCGALRANGLRAGRIRSKCGLCRAVDPLVDQCKHRLNPLNCGKSKKYPAALLTAFKNAGVSENLQVARNARLTLAKHLRKLADRKLHDSQQREDAQPRRIGQRLKVISQRKKCTHKR